MFPFRRTFENEKLQLQELNKRLSQYLSRVKQLEQENAFLVTEINTIRQNKTVEWENQHRAEMRELRRAVEQMALEKSRTEMEREKLRRELQAVQAMCREESEVRRRIDGELKGCEKQLHQTERSNAALEERLFQLENEYRSLEDAQRHEMTDIRNQIYSRAIPAVARQSYHAAPAVTMEEIEEYARTLSDSWMESFDVYQMKVEELEESIRADEAKLEDLQREKMHYTSEIKKLHSEAEKQHHLQAHLQEQLLNMQDSCHMELSQYQVRIDELEDERRALAGAIADKLRDHQDLLQVKMSLGLEVAAYRALLEGESKDMSVWTDQYSRDAQRRIDVKMPARSYAVKSSATSTWRDTRRPVATSTAYNARYADPTPSVRTTSSVSSQLRSYDVTSATAASRQDHHRSPAARRDMLSFTRASQSAAVSATPTLPMKDAEKRGVSSQKKTQETTRISLAGNERLGATGGPAPPTSPNAVEASKRSVRVVSPPMMSLVADTDEGDRQQVRVNKTEIKMETGVRKQVESFADGTRIVTGGAWDGFKRTQPEGQAMDKPLMEAQMDVERSDADTKEEVFPSERKVLETISMEDIIEKVVKPAGLDAKLTSSPDSKVTYHVEKTEDDDGTTKTKIVLQSKVEEDLDLSDDYALEDLLDKGVKTISLDDVKGTPTGDMIQNLLSLGLQGAGADLQNKTVNVEIVEEPVEDHSDQETEEEKLGPKIFQSSTTSSMFFQIEELESDPQGSYLTEGSAEAAKVSVAAGGYQKSDSATFREGSGTMDYGSGTMEYFVSTPEDNASEHEEGEEGEFPAYGRYGGVDDLSDERYYREEEAGSHKGAPETIHGKGEHLPSREGFPGYVIEEEVHVSPSMQESMLGLLKGDSMDPKQQLRGALEQLQGTVSGPLKDELALFGRGGLEGSENLSVDIQKVQRASEDGKMTIVAELNVSQTLEDSGLLEEAEEEGRGNGISQEQIASALQSRVGGGNYTVRVSEYEEDIGPWTGRFSEEGYMEESSASKSEKVIRIGPSEKSFTFQMDVGGVSAATPATDGTQQA
ncbi:hypothetical protein JZ751_015356 [Albula glossodonta]|uniref:IF rod domain-containing protein n=1 Tax=Albula glossodonta TaxID=121402 RepID=A0A8T2MVF7_9TELE|nr:hypothetical protein JZ751_015356 [Albula glossodonta]